MDVGPTSHGTSLTTWKLRVEYEGTRYAGWQRQPRDLSIQEVLEDALARQLGERVAVVAAGRTDAGVHAYGQVVSLRTRSRVPAPGIVHGTNALLPDDVAVRSAEVAEPEFHARRDAVGKLYRYRIYCGRIRSPLRRRFSHQVSVPLDPASMVEAGRRLSGTHDFSAFRNAGSVEGSAVRTIRRLDIDRLDEYLWIEVEGDGFLYKMVRNLVGTLLLAGSGKLGAEDVSDILESGDRARAGPTAPARGLSLVEVYY